MKELKKEIKQQAIDNILDCEGVCGCDLHNRLYNEDYFIIGTYQATQAMGADAFECIGIVQEYEQDNFGEVNTDLSSPEKVVNMVAYIIGEEFLGESKTLMEKWGDELSMEDIVLIKAELEETV